MGLIEPVFGHIQQRGVLRFTRRGQAKADAQWKLFCIAHNVAKLQFYGKMAAQAGKRRQDTPRAAVPALKISAAAADHR